MKSLLAIILSFSLQLSSFAATNAVEQSLDKLSYRISVEWDQVDKVQLVEIFENFHSELEELGVKNKDEVLSTIQKRSFGNNDFNHFKEVSELAIEKEWTLEELMPFISRYVEANQAKGASFTGDSEAAWAIGILIGLTIVLFIIAENSNTVEFGWHSDVYLYL